MVSDVFHNTAKPFLGLPPLGEVLGVARVKQAMVFFSVNRSSSLALNWVNNQYVQDTSFYMFRFSMFFLGLKHDLKLSCFSFVRVFIKSKCKLNMNLSVSCPKLSITFWNYWKVLWTAGNTKLYNSRRFISYRQLQHMLIRVILFS